MDKVISARIDADVADLLDRVTKRFRRTKKEFLESAIRREAEAQESQIARRLEIIERTAGAWKRDEPPEETVRQIRETWEQEWTERQRRYRGE